MWKKFCVAILSCVVLSGITVMSQQLFASSISKIIIEQKEPREYYINEDIKFQARSQNELENILFISGGNVIGNSDEYTIPLQVEATEFVLKDITKPGVYQGSIDTQVTYLNHHNVESVTTPFSFILYGKAFQQTQYNLNINDKTMLQTYGTLPETLQNASIQYHCDDESIAQVDETGQVTALKSGTTNIHVSVLNEHGVLLSKSSCKVLVNEKEKTEIKFETAIPGEEYEYRFIEMQKLKDEDTKDKTIGSIQVGQSGIHTYYVDKEYEDDLRIENGNIILKTDVKANIYEAIVYARHEESKKIYKIPVSYRIQEKSTEDEVSAFAFRYNGEDVNHILHAYQEGANSFQISSNQAIGDVYFKLKDEMDNAYFTISQTGNVSIKQVTNQPVIVLATWKKQVYELPVVIEKAEQVISQDVQNIVVQVQDGSFEPIIKGTHGTGTLMLTSQNPDVASISMNKDQRMSIQPNAVGSTIIDVYNNGDANYKKSNVLHIQVEVIEDEHVSNVLQAQSDWLLYEKDKSVNSWYHEDVVFQINPEVEKITEFSYQGEWMKELTIFENGVHNLPFTFRNDEEDSESNALMVQIAIDTHAPMITEIHEVSVTDNPIKQLLNEATFQKAYGTGMKISIQASDYLTDKQIEVSGVATIDYKVYALKDDQEELLLAGTENTEKDYLDILVDDTQPHKVCASVRDNAGLTSPESCTILDDEVVTLASDHSGIILKGSAFLANTNFDVEDILDEVLVDDVYLDEDQVIQAALKFNLDKDVVKTKEDMIDIVIPLRTQDEILSNGTWKQKQENGSFEDVMSTYKEGSCTITTNLLSPLIYVQDKNTESDLQALKIANLSKQDNTMQPSNVVNSAFRTSNFEMTDIDNNLLFCISAGVIVLLFAIILLRANHEEYDD